MKNQHSLNFSFILICLLAVTIGCKSQDIPPNFDMEALNDYVVNDGMPDFQKEINDYLEPRMPTCDGTTGLEDFDPVLDRSGSCIEFDASIYNSSDAGEKISKAIKTAKNKKAAFEKYFAPLSVYVQSRTGYPASALLAQWADETAWGTSKQVRVNNNIGGHSCFKYNENYSYPPASRGEAPDFAKPPFQVECTYKRPSQEGAYYMTFSNMIDASLSQAYNILHNPATSKNYASARKVVGQALQNKEKPDPARVIRGLNGYAAFPPDYKERLIRHMRNEGYEDYDNRDICRDQTSEAENEEGDKDPTKEDTAPAGGDDFEFEAPEKRACIQAGGTLGLNPNAMNDKCCEGLVRVPPAPGLMGTRGTCEVKKEDTISERACIQAGGTLGLNPIAMNDKCCEGLVRVPPAPGLMGTRGTCEERE